MGCWNVKHYQRDPPTPSAWCLREACTYYTHSDNSVLGPGNLQLIISHAESWACLHIYLHTPQLNAPLLEVHSRNLGALVYLDALMRIKVH